ncbi:PIG-L family deacetylase [Streptomyces sp. NPDC046866]|uniref:PIG-L family deacetylase n=1 Tax=Streptomyces sp. NPDC046866 TaxID=3154921 RepID=UPI00345145AB
MRSESDSQPAAGAVAAPLRRTARERRRRWRALPLALGIALSTIAPLLQVDVALATGEQPAGARRGVEPGTECRPTLTGVAHQDDDLLFINPEVQRLVRRRCAVGTVYLTAGDAGHSFTEDRYVQRREEGLRASYAAMAGVANRWHRSDLTVRGHRLVSFVLDERPDVRLVFLRLPDGFSKGAGSARYSGQSLLKLFRGQTARIRAVDGAGSYTREELTSVISGVVSLLKAQRILTLDYDSTTFGVGPPNPADHSDHEMTGRFFRKAAFLAPARPAVASYVGYGLSLLPANLTPQQRRDKEAAYAAYLRYAGCPKGPCPARPALSQAFRRWMAREHTRFHRRPRPGEIVSAMGHTNAKAAVERCLTRGLGRFAGTAVATADCDGRPGQQWTFAGATVKDAGSGACLTASTEVAMAPCSGSAAQTWWRDADGRIGTGSRCLHQDDLAMPRPRLTLAPCGPYQPEVRWQW